jgi:hypothetical protein
MKLQEFEHVARQHRLRGNKLANCEAIRIYRPVACKQVSNHTEAAVNAIVDILTNVDLNGPCRPETMWRKGQ